MHNTTEQIIISALLKLGISPNTKGYHYIFKAVEISLDSQGSTLNFSKQLYPIIADCFKVSSLSIERAIRTAIHTGYSHCDTNFAYIIFKNTLQSKYDIPTNTLFITALAQWIRLQ